MKLVTYSPEINLGASEEAPEFTWRLCYQQQTHCKQRLTPPTAMDDAPPMWFCMLRNRSCSKLLQKTLVKNIYGENDKIMLIMASFLRHRPQQNSATLTIPFVCSVAECCVAFQMPERWYFYSSHWHTWLPTY